MPDGSSGQNVNSLEFAVRRAVAIGPDWSGVTFAVACGRCGADLAGAQEPRCPSCRLEFDWVDVLPVERMRCPTCGYGVYGLPTPRCPECGEGFDWDEVLAVARDRPTDLFEDQWIKDPLRSLGKSWWLAGFRPRRLWERYEVHNRPKILPLLLLAAVQWAIFSYGWDVPATAATWSMNRLATAFETGQRFTYFFRPPRGFFTHMALWYVLTFVSLLAFVQSRRRFRVRWRHVLRVYVHATVFASMLVLARMLGEWLVDVGLLCFVPLRQIVNQRTYQTIGLFLFGLGWLVTWRHLWLGYRHYLKVPRGWGVAALALVLGDQLARLMGIYL